MKKTIDINLGGSPFIVDEDAYAVLKNYLDDVASRLPDGDAEVMGDVEARIAELLQNHLSIRLQVVDAERVRSVISVMGRPEEFGEKKHIDRMKEDLRGDRGPRRLYRNMNDRWLGGVCSGLAAYLDLDTTLVRVIMLLLFLFGGVGLPAYIILWIVVPKAWLRADGSVEFVSKS
jgi:phage shock protein PspC (stress-responsive transcriptional regulator)